MRGLSVSRVARAEAYALSRLAAVLETQLDEVEIVVDLLLAADTVIVTGMGKSGHVARKVAATMTSLGKRAVFLHPAEAAHGDLGLVKRGDVVLAFSWSGETAELEPVRKFCEESGIDLVAVTSNPGSSLTRSARRVIVLPRLPEACVNGQAPTVSTAMQMALGDGLAVAISTDRGFTRDDFKRLHPGGSLGSK